MSKVKAKQSPQRPSKKKNITDLFLFILSILIDPVKVLQKTF